MAAFDSNVNVTVEAAFGYDPFDTPVWTDITTYVRGFSTRRGRSRLLDRVQAGSATFLLDNLDGRFDPNNTAGAYSPNVKVMCPIRVQAVYNTVTYDLFRGFVEQWPQTYPATGKDAVVEVSAIDGFRLFAQYEKLWSSGAAVAAGTRIGAILDDVGWPAGWRSLDTGTHLVAVEEEFTTALDLIERVELVEQGFFYVDGAGNAVFLDGVTRIEDQASSNATFGDGGGAELPYGDLSIDWDDKQVWNSAYVTRAGGEEQSASDATSVSSYGRRDLHLEQTAHYSDGEAQALADWLVAEYKDIRPRLQQIVLRPQRDVDVWPQALGLDMLDRVTVTRRPPSGDTFTEDFHVVGVDHSVAPFRWETRLQLAPVLPFTDWWVLGTSELGTDTRLGY